MIRIITYGLSLGVGFLTSSMRPDMFLRKRLWRCFSSMSRSLREGLPPPTILTLFVTWSEWGTEAVTLVRGKRWSSQLGPSHSPLPLIAAGHTALPPTQRRQQRQWESWPLASDQCYSRDYYRLHSLSQLSLSGPILDTNMWQDSVTLAACSTWLA